MKFICTLLLCCATMFSQAQSTVKLISWNLFNFGQSKTEEELKYIAKIIKKCDVAGIIEVNAGDNGPEEVEKLKAVLNEAGEEWDYEVSEATSSTGAGSERYAVFWNVTKLKRVSAAVLESFYADEIEREPFLVGFRNKDGKTFTIAPFHAVPTNKKPQNEVPYLQYIPGKYKQKNIIFCGDFNLSGEHQAFDPLKSKGYKAAFVNQKTSLKQSCPTNTDCLSSIYDNVFFKSAKVKMKTAQVIEFYKDFDDFATAHHLSDHIPVCFEFSLN